MHNFTQHDTINNSHSRFKITSSLLNNSGGGIIRCVLPGGESSDLVKNNTAHELLYIVSGTGEIWCKNSIEESVTALTPGVSVDLPLGINYQYKNTSNYDLVFTRVTMRSWPQA